MGKGAWSSVVLRFLLLVAYLLVMVGGFLSGMGSEGLIGSTHPAAEVLADVIVWFGAAVGLSPFVAVILNLMVTDRPVARWIIRLSPFVLLMVQFVLIAVAGIL